MNKKNNKSVYLWTIIWVIFAAFLVGFYLYENHFLLDKWYYYPILLVGGALAVILMILGTFEIISNRRRRNLDEAEKGMEQILPKKVNEEAKRHYLLYILASLLILVLVGYFAVTYAKDKKEAKKNQDLTQQQIDLQKNNLIYRPNK